MPIPDAPVAVMSHCPKTLRGLKYHLIMVVGNLAVAVLAGWLLLFLCGKLSDIFNVPILQGNGGPKRIFVLTTVFIFALNSTITWLLGRVNKGRNDC